MRPLLAIFFGLYVLTSASGSLTAQTPGSPPRLHPLTFDMVYKDVRMGFAPQDLVAKIRQHGCQRIPTARDQSDLLHFAADMGPVVAAMLDPANLVPPAEADPQWLRLTSPLPSTPPTPEQLAARQTLLESDAELTRIKARLATAQAELTAARTAVVPAAKSPAPTLPLGREITLRRGEHRLLSELGGPNQWVTFGGADALAVHMAIGPGSGVRQDFPVRRGLEGSGNNLTLILGDGNTRVYYVDTVRRRGDEGIFLVERTH